MESKKYKNNNNDLYHEAIYNFSFPILNTIQLSHRQMFHDDYFACVDVNDILVRVLNNYRNQVLDYRIQNVSNNDLLKLHNIYTIEELKQYDGMIDVQDLSLMLDDLLEYYRPNNSSLTMDDKLMMINEFNVWLNEIQVEFEKSAADYYINYLNRIDGQIYDYYNQRRAKTFNEKNLHQSYCNTAKSSIYIFDTNENSVEFAQNSYDAIPCDAFVCWFQHINGKLLLI